MLKLSKPDMTEIEVAMMAKTTCINCGNEEVIKSGSKEMARQSFTRLGWATYETNNEVASNTCPRCIADLKIMEEDGQL